MLIGFDNIKEFSAKINTDDELVDEVELEDVVLVSKNVLKFGNKYSLYITLGKGLISSICKIGRKEIRIKSRFYGYLVLKNLNVDSKHINMICFC